VPLKRENNHQCNQSNAMPESDSTHPLRFPRPQRSMMTYTCIRPGRRRTQSSTQVSTRPVARAQSDNSNNKWRLPVMKNTHQQIQILSDIMEIHPNPKRYEVHYQGYPEIEGAPHVVRQLSERLCVQVPQLAVKAGKAQQNTLRQHSGSQE
jgi:hypothetical protein